MDRDKLTQAFINLFSNAVRYAKSEIVVEARVENDNVNITVKDDGPGINEKDLAQVFERFYKAEKGNTGLGLTITKAIIEKHRGIITATNRPEGGAVFEVVLPVKSAGQC
jgi:signal transduction histidine kinase